MDEYQFILTYWVAGGQKQVTVWAWDAVHAIADWFENIRQPGHRLTRCDQTGKVRLARKVKVS